MDNEMGKNDMHLEEIRTTWNVLVRKPEGMRPFWKLNTTKFDIKEIIYELHWNNIEQGPVVGLYKHGKTSSSSTKCEEFLHQKSK